MAFTPIKFDGRKSANVAEIDTNFQNVANEISNIESEISILPALQNDITNNKNDIFSLQSNLSIANTDIDNLQNSVSVIPTIQQDVISIYSTLGDLSVPEDILTNSDIEVTVQGYSANLTEFLSTFTLPDTDGSAGYLLATDGDGNLELVPPGGGGDMMNPMIANGDLIVGGEGGTPQRLAQGSEGQILTVEGATVKWAYPEAGGDGTVTSVGLSVPTGLSVSGSPITDSGTLTISYQSGYSIPTTEKQSQWDTAYSWGNHSEAGYLTGDNIGVTVQGYSSNLTEFLSTFTLPDTDGSAGYVLATDGVGNLELVQPISVPEDILTNSDIGVTVQAYDSNIAKNNIDNNWTAEQTVKSVKDTIYTITDDVSVDIDPTNGQIQLWILGDNRTPEAANFEDGQSVTLLIDDGAAYAITWTIVDKWFGGAPTLSTDELTGIVLFKAGGMVYGAALSEITA